MLELNLKISRGIVLGQPGYVVTLNPISREQMTALFAASSGLAEYTNIEPGPQNPDGPSSEVIMKTYNPFKILSTFFALLAEDN